MAQFVDRPLSQAQRGLWLLLHFDPTNVAYNSGGTGRLRERLDVGAFRRALDALVRRHPGLRTTFPAVDGEPVQRLWARRPVSLDITDASDWTQEELVARVADEQARPYDLVDGPLFRIHLFSVGPDDHRVVLGFHHLIGDFWSFGILFDEL